jgi:hypothetical protein
VFDPLSLCFFVKLIVLFFLQVESKVKLQKCKPVSINMNGVADLVFPLRHLCHALYGALEKVWINIMQASEFKSSPISLVICISVRYSVCSSLCFNLISS